MTSSDPVSDLLADVRHRHQGRTDGTVASYIPELARADPDAFGLAVVSALGHRYSAGAATEAFTIQSVSKPFVYALVLSERGVDDVAGHVGFEPSGEAFNAISLEPATGRPANPMINAGAIVIAALVPGATASARFERIRVTLSAFAGRDLAVDERVRRSESDTGDRNRALAHLTRAAGVLPTPVEEAVQVYFAQCALLTTAEDLAVMGATLAHGGVNPLTGARVVDEDVATLVLSVMTTCGMYDHSGEWMVRVGLPAKSGVGGGIVAVQPAVLGIGTYSAPLDGWGNSVRGAAALADLSAALRLHLLAHPCEPPSPIFATDERAGDRVVVLRGELDFVAAEQVVSHLRALAVGARGRTIHLDLAGVMRLRPAAERLLAATAAGLAEDGVTLVVGGVGSGSPPAPPGGATCG